MSRTVAALCMGVIAVLLSFPPLFAAETAAPAPTGLMCELLAMPERTEITDPQPKFSWIVGAHAPDAVQAAYQIRVAADPASLDGEGDCLWDSGIVASDQSVA